ncbi:MAG TPA: hypothetical protein ENN23_06105 [Deltaproteobacteria bacterium]|nr:hypothetical protein [Deltaproteobacteria bacterium]
MAGRFYNDFAPGKKENIRRLLIEKHPYLSEFCSDRDAEIIAVKITALQLLDGITDVYFETAA